MYSKWERNWDSEFQALFCFRVFHRWCLFLSNMAVLHAFTCEQTGKKVVLPCTAKGVRSAIFRLSCVRAFSLYSFSQTNTYRNYPAHNRTTLIAYVSSSPGCRCRFPCVQNYLRLTLFALHQIHCGSERTRKLFAVVLHEIFVY